MIKAKTTDKDGRPAMILGLTDENWRRLRANQPILFDGAPFGFDGTVTIMAGADEGSIRAVLAEFFTNIGDEAE